MSHAAAANIRRLRRARELPQREVASRAQLSRQYIALLETGERSLNPELLARLAGALNVQPAILLNSHGVCICGARNQENTSGL